MTLSSILGTEWHGHIARTSERATGRMGLTWGFHREQHVWAANDLSVVIPSSECPIEVSVQSSLSHRG
jgi:hypothetical protein